MATAKNRPKSKPTTSTSILMAEVSANFEQVPKKITKEIVQFFLTSVESHIARGEKVRIDKLGILTVKDRAPRVGLNPQTGEEIKLPASKKVSFRVSKSLKECLGIAKKKSATSAKAPAMKKKK